MRKRQRHLGVLGRLGLGFLVFWGFISLETPVYAGPWSQGVGNFYVKASQGFLWSKESVDSDGKPGGGDFFGSMTSLYAEIGLGYGFQAHTFLPFAVFRVNKGPDEFYQLSSPLDAIVGFQWTPPFLQRLLTFPIALRFDTKIPMYDTKAMADDPALRRTLPSFPLLGEGQVDFTLWLSVGGSIPKTALYLFAEVGYRFRSELFVDQRIKDFGLEFVDTFVFQSQIGYNFWGYVLLMANFNGAIPLFEDTFRVSKGFVNLGVSLYIPLWRGLALEVNFEQAVWAVAAPPPTSFGFGLSWKR